MDKKKKEDELIEEIVPEPVVEEVIPVIEEVPVEPTPIVEDKSNLPEGPVGIIDGADTRSASSG